MVIFYIMEIAFNTAIVPYLIVRFYIDAIVSYSVKCDYHCRAKLVIGPAQMGNVGSISNC